MNTSFKIKAILLMLLIAAILSIPTYGTLLVITAILYSIFHQPIHKFFDKIVR